MTSFDVLACLRERTRAQHARLDTTFRARLSSFAAPEYARYLMQMQLLYSTYERAHRPFWAIMSPNRLDWAARSKVEWIAADLAACTRDVRPPPVGAVQVPAYCLPTRWAAWGAAYVIEGSTLGGRTLLREVAPNLRTSSPCDHRFWTGYGRETGARWKAFLDALEGETREKAHLQEVLDGASTTFDLFLQAIV